MEWIKCWLNLASPELILPYLTLPLLPKPCYGRGVLPFCPDPYSLEALQFEQFSAFWEKLAMQV